jgi:hypothetical protein
LRKRSNRSSAGESFSIGVMATGGASVSIAVVIGEGVLRVWRRGDDTRCADAKHVR